MSLGIYFSIAQLSRESYSSSVPGSSLTCTATSTVCKGMCAWDYFLAVLNSSPISQRRESMFGLSRAIFHTNVQ